MRLVSIIILCCLHLACERESETMSASSATGASELNRIPPTRSPEPNPLDWLELQPADLKVLPPSADQIFLPSSDPLTRRLQFWADALDRQLQLAYPEAFYDAKGQRRLPQPAIRLQLKNGANAFVSSATACYRVPILFSGGAGELSEDTLVQIGSKGVIGLIKRDQVSCVDRWDSAADPQLIARFLTESAQIENCSLSVVDEAIHLGSDCRLNPQIKERGAAGIVLLPTTNRITFETGLFEVFTLEAQLVSTLLHELAHFYRAHGSLNKKATNYFYRLDAANRLLPRPLPEPLLNELGAQLLAMPSYRTQPVEGQEWHSELFPYAPSALANLVRPACGEGTNCQSACADFAYQLSDPKAKESFGSFPQAKLEGEALALYFRWERAKSQCYRSIRVASESGEETVSRKAVQGLYWMSRPPVDAKGEETLYDVVASMHQVLNARDEENNALLQRALDERLGYYTTEEEADNMALQWLPALGFEASSASDQWRTYGSAFDGQVQESPFNFGFRRCESLFAAEPRWTENGASVAVPIGSFSNFHHSTCFRLWNVDQRLRAQPFPPPAPSRLEEAEQHGGPYRILRSRAIELHQKQRLPREKDCNSRVCTAAL